MQISFILLSAPPSIVDCDMARPPFLADYYHLFLRPVLFSSISTFVPTSAEMNFILLQFTAFIFEQFRNY